MTRLLGIWSRTYNGDGLRLLGGAVFAVPLALRSVWRARRSATAVLRALLAVPVAAVSSALAALTAYLVVINVLAYPFRPWLGFGGSRADILASRYGTSWGGPTLAGAWATHAALILVLFVPAIAVLIRGLATVQRRLTEPRPRGSARTPAAVVPAPAPVPVQAPVAPVGTPQPRPRAPRAERLPTTRVHVATARVGTVLRRALTVVAALALVVAFSLASRWAGVGGVNVLWAPHTLASAAALAVTLAPLAGLVLVSRTGWWRAPAKRTR